MIDLSIALKKLYSMHQFNIKLGLDSINAFLNHIGNPHKKLKAIHIAGSNGKGSTASFISSILIENGFKVGLYTSPHLVRFNERIRINGEEIPDAYIAEFIDKYSSYIDANNPTFFETTTAMAFSYFAENGTEYCVIETGLGGRLDATNVLDSIASVITSISLEHTNILGNTIEIIAGEKAGIIKPKTVVISGKMSNEAIQVIRARSEQLKAEYYPINEFYTDYPDYIKVLFSKKEISLYKTPVAGKYQLINAAVAVKSINLLFKEIGADTIFKGIRNVIHNSGIQCRYEVISHKPKIIFDAAHNPESLSEFLTEFSKEFGQFETTELIIGMMKDKDIPQMLKIVQPYFRKIYVTEASYERSAKIKYLLSEAAKLGISAFPLSDASNYIDQFKRANQPNCLVVLGSIYLLGEIKSKIMNKTLDN